MFECVVANITGLSGQTWAASRDNCYPLSTWLSQIHPQFQIPVNAAVLSAISTTLYGLIYVESTTAFTSMVNANIVCMMTSYIIPHDIVAWRGRSTVLPGWLFDLEKWGQLVNVRSCL
ncbi:hypothetical protein BDV38DRAFT_61466 [Aspergillus pseudotamarii]|uniref:Amino acid permease/ SLC12A domain-containing protein n=1 Tax=Aspergillus pseudotamarii TaxID=132259 RepID=A0A5N6SVZ3_ASPPS|nr:uncharacterized protein BDV38DRAFT_61466 [Aspergillus pseudotamarii]KAE8138858.1 hypothetical protein BDV38DRAFT_61466 [Aspergillus pseudotamarii]